MAEGEIERMVRVVFKPQAYEIRMNDTLEWDSIQKAFCRIFKIEQPIHVTYFHKDRFIKVDDNDSLRTFIREDLVDHRLEVVLAQATDASKPNSEPSFTQPTTPIQSEPKPHIPDYKPPQASKSFDPLKRAADFRNLCQAYQDVFSNYPQLAVLNEFFVDQILNGVPIDVDVFEKGLQRHSILSSSMPTPSRQSSSNGGFSNSPTRPGPSAAKVYSYAGSDMAD